MKLTVVTVVKDDPLGLERTIASVDEQCSDEPFEHLIVDSSSVPLSGVHDSHEGAVQRSVVVTPPHGVYPAMNVGVDRACGDYLWFVNAGDTLAAPDSVGTVLELLSSDPSWLVGRVRITDQSGRSVDSSRWDFETESGHLFARGVFPPHQATIVRTADLRELGGFDTSYSVAADYHAALRLARRHSPVMTDTVLACFTEGGLSTRRWKTAHREFHRARQEVFEPAGVSALAERAWTVTTFGKELVHRSVSQVRA